MSNLRKMLAGKAPALQVVVPMAPPPPPPTPVAPPAGPTIKSAADLQAKQFSPVRYVVPGYFCEGLTLLAGRPKVGKSWLTLDVGLAVASGGDVLGARVEQGDVLGLFLEDNERRLKTRIQKILGPFIAWPARFTYATEWARVDEGGLDQIRAWIAAASNPRLIIVDVLARVRSQQQGRQAQYEADYHAIAGLQAIASEHRIAVVVVHHLRKSASESGDAIDKISGTLGLSGAADAILVLDREGSGVTMYARGRDIEEIETAVEFDRGACRWRVLGQASDVRRSDERKAILDALREAGRPMKRTEIAAAVEKSANATDQLLWKMLRDGEVTKSDRGLYALTPDKNDKIVSGIQPIIATPPPPC